MTVIVEVLVRRLTATLFTLFLMASLVAAQGVPSFGAWRHLDGWEERTEGEFADLYSVDEFQALEGKELSEEELADARARWAAECARVDLLSDALQKDSNEMAIRSLLKRLGKHRYLGNIDYTRVDTYEPFVFMVARPPKDDPNYAEEVAKFYGPWFEKIEEIFRREFIEPLELKRRPDTPYVIFILASRGAYRDFADAIGVEGLNRARAHYDPTLQIAVTYRDSFGYDRDRKMTERRAAMHELVHAMQHAHYDKSMNLPENPWLNEGLAEYLSSHEEVVPRVLEAHFSDSNALSFMLGLSRNPLLAKAVLFPLEEILTIKGYAHVVLACIERAKEVGAPQVDYSELGLQAFYVQSNLWMHFLRHGEDGRYSDRFSQFLGVVQRGAGVEAAFREAFDGVDLAVVDREFRKHVNSEAKKRLGQTGLPSISLEPFRMGDKAFVGEASAPALTAFDPEALLPATEDREVEFASALGLASQGRFGAARVSLLALAAEGGPEWQNRAQVEAHRLEVVIEARTEFLKRLQTIGSKLILRGDTRIVAKIDKLEEDFVFLAKNKSGVDKLALDDIDAVELAGLMRTKKYKFDAGLAPGYVYLLVGDKRWKKALDAADSMTVALVEEGQDGYAEHMALARVVLELRRFHKLGIPEEADACKAALASVQELYGDETPLAREKRPMLASYANELLNVVFDAGGIQGALRGKVTDLGKGRVRIDYPLKDASEEEDFGECYSIAGMPQQSSEFAIGGGRASAQGRACLRHRVSFTGKQVHRFHYRRKFPRGSTQGQLGMSIGFNANEMGYCISFTGTGIEVLDPSFQSSGAVRVPDDPTQLVKVELRYDGKEKVEVHINGRMAASIASGPRQEGDFFVSTMGSLIFELSELSVEGNVSPDSVTQLRSQWVDSELRARGLR